MVGCVPFWVVIFFQVNDRFTNSYFLNILFVWVVLMGCKTSHFVFGTVLPLNVSLLELRLIQVEEFHGVSNMNSLLVGGWDGWLIFTRHSAVKLRRHQDGKCKPRIPFQGDDYRSLALLGLLDGVVGVG